ncbi:Cullin protein neddylation domain containing protein [Novymonas esmeraldas]|uniref:Cullin protein neddylation domain containing protein n=1 Tax=Novymonas esmeraldas TaxID=1808958 RepID=A0AAW0EY79_9TRYP
MAFCAAFSEAEAVELKKLDDIYARLFPPHSNSRAHDAGAPSVTHECRSHNRIPVRDFFTSTDRTASAERGALRDAAIVAAWKAMVREVNGEVVVRGAQNVRNTPVVTQRILSWCITFKDACEASIDSLSGDEPGRVLTHEWVRGIVLYFKERMEVALAELNVVENEKACLQALAIPAVDGVDLISRCVEHARCAVSPLLITSPYFISVVKCCRELVLALRVMQGLLQYMSANNRFVNTTAPHASADGRRGFTPIMTIGEDLLEPLQTPQWLFRLVLIFLGALNLQQLPERGAVFISEHHLDNAIHSIASLVAEVDMRRDRSTASGADVRATLDALVLSHIKNACTFRFPADRTLALLDDQAALEAAVASAPLTVDNVLARCQPLLQRLLVDYPSFITSTTKFSERNEVRDWGVSLMLAQLFCWDIRTPPASTSPATPVTYHIPKANAPYPFQSIALSAMVRDALRVLLSTLLSNTRWEGNTAESGVAESHNAGGGASVSTAPPLPPFEQRIAALLLALVTQLRGISFPSAPRMTRWVSLHVGDQNMREYALGEECFKNVISVVLNDVIAAALDQVENRCSTAASTALDQKDPSLRLHLAVLRYLHLAERTWDAVTGHFIELDQSAFQDVIALGFNTSILAPMSSAPGVASPFTATAAASAPGVAAAEGRTVRAMYKTSMMGECKSLFYDAVQHAMKERWPKRFADLLIDPLLHSIHVYMLRSESSNQRDGVGPRPVPPTGPPGRAVGAKRPRPPPPEHERAGPALPPTNHDVAGPAAAVRAPAAARAAAFEQEFMALTSKEDFYGALRLVRCIKNRDHFINLYLVTVKERLLTRPAPDVIADAELEENKKRQERDAEEFLTTWLGDANLLKSVRELHVSYAAQSALFKAPGVSAEPARDGAVKDMRLTTIFLDWRLWGDKEAGQAPAPDSAGETGDTAAALPVSATELIARASQARVTATSATAPLPFPADALEHLNAVERAYNQKHSNRMLRWEWNKHAYVTFTLPYPKESGRLTTINGTLLLQRLFLAVAAYGRSGVETETLARRAGLDAQRLTSVLKPCLDRDRLLVRLGGGEAERIALNYDYTRPPNRPRGEYTYWPNAERRRVAASSVEQDATITRRRAMIRTSIMQVMKHVQRVMHDELYNTVREKNAKVFDVTVRNFKQEIEGLIGDDFMERSDKNANEYLFRA